MNNENIWGLNDLVLEFLIWLNFLRLANDIIDLYHISKFYLSLITIVVYELTIVFELRKLIEHS